MSKPTPGPYFIREREGGNIVTGTMGIQVAWFGRGCIAGEGESYSIDQSETLANARAWVEGRAAVETLLRIREYAEEKGEGNHVRVRLLEILDEPATSGKEST